VLALAESGALRGMSFSGQFRATKSAGKVDGLAVKERTEIAMVEYGPTPFPAYSDAAIVAVRSEFSSLSDDELALILGEDDAMRARLADLLASLTPVTGPSESSPTSSPDTGHVVVLTPSQRRLRDLILTKETAR
jgi:hypothetical protein